MLRKLIKYFAALSPFPLTKNEYYDRLTEKVIKKVCIKDSVCIDVGANKGKILRLFIRHCPNAIHFAFEPIDALYFLLVRKYGSAARIFKIALSNKKALVDFSHTINNAAYSSLIQRKDIAQMVTKQIEVETDCLDNLIPANTKVSFIKLDVEGGEYHALVGAEKTIARCKPYILFEFGKGGADAFKISPVMIFNFLSGLGYEVNLLKHFLKNEKGFTLNSFSKEYEKGNEYFFIAHHVEEKIMK
jgi:FkbM family methyltransferase